jgi:dihydrolipoamide dehydrogenase
VPDIGDFHDVEVIEVLVKAGDTVALEAPLITLETDKATMDVPSTAAGRIAEVSVKKGDRVSKGSPIAVIEAEGAGRCIRREVPGPRGPRRRRRPPQQAQLRHSRSGYRTSATSRTSR